MIRKDISKICKDYHLIENYEKAINDNEHIWICHHRLGIYFSRQELIDANMYEGVSPYELIFLTYDDHNKIHLKDKPKTEEHRNKLSESKSGNKNPYFGKFGDQNPMYNRNQTEESKQKMRDHHNPNSIKKPENRAFLNDGKQTKQLKPIYWTDYLDAGWTFGMVKKKNNTYEYLFE